MIQHQRPHQPGTFARCAGCGREPKHVEVRGYSTRDTSSPRGADDVGHMLECYPCRACTGTVETLDAAIAAWTLTFAAAPSLARSSPAPSTHLRAIK